MTHGWSRSARRRRPGGGRRGPRRMVVDQVCLVPDVPSFFEAIAAWDERHFFPILIDEPAWTLPFLRAFRPSRVVRYVPRGDDGRAASQSTRRQGPDRPPRMALWRAAIGAVARAWSDPSVPDGKTPTRRLAAPRIGSDAPGLVLTAPDSPMLAGAVALAAGTVPAAGPRGARASGPRTIRATPAESTGSAMS